MFPPQAVINPEWRSSIDDLVATCRQEKLDCTFILSPLNARILYGYHHYHLWSELEALVRRLAVVGGTYDFLEINRLTAEAGNEKSKWIDPLHHTAEVGNWIIDFISGKRSFASNDNEVIGKRLTESNINETLSQLQAQRDKWMAEHPEIAWSYDQLADNLAHPVGKSTVTEVGELVQIRVEGRTWTAKNKITGEASILGRDFSPAQRFGHLSGWAADTHKKATAERVAVVYGDVVATWSRPWFDASGNGYQDVPAEVARSGFHFGYQLPSAAIPGKRLRVFSLFADGAATELGPDQGILTW